MLYKTRGLALSHIKYRETSIIARIFTEAFGMQSYIVNSVRSKNAKAKIALFQPLTLLDLVVYHNQKKEINRISEMKCLVNFNSIPYDIRKTTMAMFITEFLGKTLREESENAPLFDFLFHSVQVLDEMPSQFENFHLQFLLQCSKYLGIKPISAEELLKETGSLLLQESTGVQQLQQLLDKDYGFYVAINRNRRHALLMAIIDFYRYHFDNITELKSVQVLREVFG